MSRSKIFKILLTAVTAIIIIADVFLFKQNLAGHKITFQNKQQDVSSGKSLADFYLQAQQLGPQTQQNASASFLAVGDIMLSRNVAAEIQKANDVNLPFSKIESVLKSTDFNFGNLESPIVPSKEADRLRGEAIFIGGHSMIFGAPSDYAAGLKQYNFQVLNLANNHAFDQGLAGLKHTIEFLNKNFIKHVGLGENLDQAWQPAIMEANGLKIGFIGASYASINDNGKTTNNYAARIEDLEHLKSSILNLKSQADFVVVTMHAGTEYTTKPNDAQIKFAHAAVDYGADVVIGAHPHWVQTIEHYCPGTPETDKTQIDNKPYPPSACKYIFYSLGNFIFDQEFSQDTKEGLTLKITISKAKLQNPATPGAATLDDLQGPRKPANLDSIELVPVIIENYSTPRPATAEETKKILDKIGQKETILK